MGARVNTAIWMESSQRWRIDVQKDGVRRSFYSGGPGEKDGTASTTTFRSVRPMSCGIHSSVLQRYCPQDLSNRWWDIPKIWIRSAFTAMS